MPNVNDRLTFGLEVEGVRATPDSHTIAAHRNFIQRYDHSIKDDHGRELPRTVEEGGGFEYITPVLNVGVRMNNVGERLIIDWGDTQTIVRDLCSCIAHVNKSCGVHVHLGKPQDSLEHLNTSKWEPEKVRTMLTVGMLLENKIFDVVPESRRGNHHSNFIRSRYTNNDLGQFYPTGNVVARKFDNIKRYCWMNLIETRRIGTEARIGRGASQALGTIEIRALGNTASYDYISAWLTLWMKISAYVAYLPSSLAIMRCAMATDTLEGDFANLAKLKQTVSEETHLPAEPAAPPMPGVAQAADPIFPPQPPVRRPLNINRPRRPRPTTPVPATSAVDVLERANQLRRQGVPRGEDIRQAERIVAEQQVIPANVPTPTLPDEIAGIDENMDADSRRAIERARRRVIDRQARITPADVNPSPDSDV